MTTLQASSEFFRAPPSTRTAAGPASLPLRPPADCSFCMFFSSLTLSKKVTGHSYVKFYDLQLLFETFFRYLLPFSRYKRKTFFGGGFFAKLGVNPAFLEAAFLTIVFRRYVLPNIQNAANLPKKSISDLRLLAYKMTEL